MEKKAISLLTRILRSHGISNCSAETFRLAKHDQTEAVVPMWYLLKNMIENICYPHHEKRCLLQFTQHCNDVTTHHHHQQQQQQHDDVPLCHVVVFVQNEFHKLGYMSWDFYQLSKDDVSFGSRDLLLAFAWLMCSVDFIGLLLKRLSLSEHTTPTFTGTKNDGVARKISPMGNIIDYVKHMILIHGKIMLTCRQLYALQREQNRLTHKLHVSTQGMSLQPGLNHLTPVEAQLLRTSQEKLVFHLEDINSKIEDILKWKEFENAFWKWMESVVMLKAANSEKVVCDGQNENKMTNSASLDLSITTDVKVGLQKAKKRLNETLVQCGSHINDLDSICHQKQPTLSSKEHDKVIREFHTKVKKLDTQNNKSSSSSVKKLAFVNEATNQHIYCFDCSKSRTNNTATAESNSKKILKKKDSVEEDIVYVNEKNISLKKKLEKELDSISNEFQHLICIPVSN